LKHGIKNAIGVEGTNVPDAVASLTAEKTVTVFVDGDRGGELILRELLQVGDVDYVVFAPADQSVEDLSREEVHSLLREKIAADRLGDVQNIRETIAGLVETGDTDTASSETDAENQQSAATETTASTDADSESPTEVEVIPTSSAETTERSTETVDPASTADPESTGADPEPTVDTPTADETPDGEAVAHESPTEAEAETPATLQSHVREVIDEGTGTARLLSESFELLAEVDADELPSALETSDDVAVLVFDGELSQQLLDIAAQHGLDHIVARSTGEFVKQPVDTRVLTAEQLQTAELDVEA
jgi:DNA primase